MPRAKRNVLPELAAYALWLEGQGLSTRTVEQRLLFADARAREWGTLDVEAHVVANWLSEYRGWSRLTYLANFRSVYRWRVEDGQASTNPVERIRRNPMPRPKANPLSQDQLDRVISTASGDLRAWLMLATFAGLRLHEVAKVRGSDIDQTSVRIHGKGGTDDVVPTHPLLWELAQTYPADDWWFPSAHSSREHISMSQISTQIRQHFDSLGIDQRGGIHRCRHTFLTSLSRAGVRIEVISRLARHASIVTTQRYLQVLDEECHDAIALIGLPDGAGMLS